MIYDIYEIYDNICNRLKKCSYFKAQQSTFELTVGISRNIAAFQLLDRAAWGHKSGQLSNSRRELARLS